MAGAHTLQETERQVSTLLRGMKIDFKAMAVVSNLFRAASAVRNHLEREILSPWTLLDWICRSLGGLGLARDRNPRYCRRSRNIKGNFDRGIEDS